jgi:hypothetical protein
MTTKTKPRRACKTCLRKTNERVRQNCTTCALGHALIDKVYFSETSSAIEDLASAFDYFVQSQDQGGDARETDEQVKTIFMLARTYGVLDELRTRLGYYVTA